MFNPAATFLFCPDQTDFLCFRSPEGFAAVDLNLVEGFTAGAEEAATGRINPELTTIQLTNNSQYFSAESVPTLVARFSAVKALRYRKERGETERVEKNTLVLQPPAAPVVTPPAPAAPAARSGIWVKPGSTENG